MKKATLSAALLAVLSAGLLSSCNKEKDWTCACEIAGDRTETPILSQKKSDAKDACDALERNGASCSLD